MNDIIISADNHPHDENGDLRWVRETLLPGFDLPDFKSCFIEHHHGRQFVRLWAQPNPRLQDEVVFAAVQDHEMEFVEVENASEMCAQDLATVAVVLTSLYTKVAAHLSDAGDEDEYTLFERAQLFAEAEGLIAAANHILHSEGGKR